MKSEADVKKAIKKILVDAHAWYFMPVQTGYGAMGIPDFIVCHRGVFIGIEAKFGKNKESAWQKKQGAAIAEAEGVYLVINEKNVGELPATLDAYTELILEGG
jgi:predicted RecB family nuclease